MKTILTTAALALAALTASAQATDPVVMRVNGKPVTRSEFEYNFNKNNTDGVIDKKSVEEYAELFVNYKLKVEAALDARLDEGTPDAEAPIRPFDADAKLGPMPELLLRSDTTDARRAHDGAADLGKDLYLVVALRPPLQVPNLVLQGKTALVGIGEQIVRLLMRQVEAVECGARVGGRSVTQDALPAVPQLYHPAKLHRPLPPPLIGFRLPSY